MEDLTRKFALEKMRSRQGAIVDVIGNQGNWPFRRTISYHVGVNCDAIENRDGFVRVHRRGRTIAIAEMPPRQSTLLRLLRSGLEPMLHPRHARNASDGPQDVKWENLLQPRRRK